MRWGSEGAISKSECRKPKEIRMPNAEETIVRVDERRGEQLNDN
jgi:hypothetical protein